jgi:protease I
MVAAGAIFVDACAIDDAVVSDDGKFITGCAWPGHPAWLRAFIKALGATITI